MLCEGAFGWINRKHHCRNCGIVVCGHCSSNKQYIAAYQSMQRVCKKCFRVILSDTEEGIEKWAEINRKYSEIWPNISEKKEAPNDAEEWQNVEDKYKKYFSEKPGG